MEAINVWRGVGFGAVATMHGGRVTHLVTNIDSTISIPMEDK